MILIRLVPLNSVKEGVFLGRTLYDSDERILLNKGVELNNDLIERIRSHGICTIYINDEFSQNELEDIIKPELRAKAVSTLKKSFNSISKIYSYSKDSNSISRKKEEIKVREETIHSLKNVSSSILDDLSSNKNLVVNLVDIKSADSYTYQHSVNVSILSLVLGIDLGLNRDELENLCLGSLLHDIGKMFIDKSILTKEVLTESEREEYNNHTVFGFDYLKDSIDINPTARIIALQHHSRIDNSGYPKGVEGKNISKLSKIVSIADTYDSLTSNIQNGLPLSPNDAIEYIMGAAGRYFDFEMAQLFCRNIVPYPEGTLVKLSDNTTAIVNDTNVNYPLRPTVSVLIQTPTTVEMKPIDLLTRSNLTIQGIEY